MPKLYRPKSDCAYAICLQHVQFTPYNLHVPATFRPTSDGLTRLGAQTGGAFTACIRPMRDFCI